MKYIQSVPGRYATETLDKIAKTTDLDSLALLKEIWDEDTHTASDAIHYHGAWYLRDLIYRGLIWNDSGDLRMTYLGKVFVNYYM